LTWFRHAQLRASRDPIESPQMMTRSVRQPRFVPSQVRSVSIRPPVPTTVSVAHVVAREPPAKSAAATTVPRRSAMTWKGRP
jgi:hypothetical protein